MDTSRRPYNRARSSCTRVLEALGDRSPAWVDPAAVAAYAAALDVAHVRAAGGALAQDANATKVDAAFPSATAEAALITLMHALDFGGGWRLALHAHNNGAGRGAWKTIKPGVEAIYAACPELSAAWLASRTRADVATLFDLPADASADLAPFVDQVAAVVREVGRGVAAAGVATLGAWLEARLDAAWAAAPGGTLEPAGASSAGRHGPPAPAACLVADLVEAFPFTFDDRYVVRPGSARAAPRSRRADRADCAEAAAAVPGGSRGGDGDDTVAKDAGEEGGEATTTNGGGVAGEEEGLEEVEVVLFKKAQLVVGEIFHRFRGEAGQERDEGEVDEDEQEEEEACRGRRRSSSNNNKKNRDDAASRVGALATTDPAATAASTARFSFTDGPQLTAFIDNVICAVCRKLGLVVVSPKLAARIDDHELLPSGGLDEVALRAAAMAAVEGVATARAADGLQPTELGNYFWGVLGKTPEFRKYTRHATRDTVFY